jgi:hypothetical protein
MRRLLERQHVPDVHLHCPDATLPTRYCSAAAGLDPDR